MNDFELTVPNLYLEIYRRSSVLPPLHAFTCAFSVDVVNLSRILDQGEVSDTVIEVFEYFDRQFVLPHPRGCQGRRPGPGPISFVFMQFSPKIIDFRPKLLDPPLGY